MLYSTCPLSVHTIRHAPMYIMSVLYMQRPKGHVNTYIKANNIHHIYITHMHITHVYTCIHIHSDVTES